MQVAEYVAVRLSADRAQVINEAAAWLVARGEARQAGYLAKDVARVLSQSGYLFAEVTTARPLNVAAKADIESYLKVQTGATTVELAESINPRVIGGVRIETPTAILEGTVHNKLVNLVEGMSR